MFVTQSHEAIIMTTEMLKMQGTVSNLKLLDFFSHVGWVAGVSEVKRSQRMTQTRQAPPWM